MICLRGLPALRVGEKGIWGLADVLIGHPYLLGTPVRATLSNACERP
jgi:hypothetical protein